MAVWEGKKFKMIESEKFDEYLKALGKFNCAYTKQLFLLIANLNFFHIESP